MGRDTGRQEVEETPFCVVELNSIVRCVDVRQVSKNASVVDIK